MAHAEKNQWLDAATARIRFGPDQEAVRRELDGHIEDLRDRYIERGISPEIAEALAIDEMGDASEIAAELGRLHRPWWGWLWKCSQSILLLVSVTLACLILASLSHAPYEIRRNGLDSYLDSFHWYRYLTWEPQDYFEEELRQESITYAPGQQLIIDGNTIHLSHLRRDTYDRGGYLMDILYLDLDIQLDIPGNPLSLSDAIIYITDSAGNYYSPEYIQGDLPMWSFSNGASWLWGQKARFRVMHPPEDIQWLEVAFGYGDYRRTMHIDLTEEVEP